MHRFPKLGAIAVIVREGRALLVQRGKSPDAGLWGFPGGHVEPGETAMAAAVRELHEETGVRATALEYLTNIDVVRHDAAGAVSAHYLLAAVLCDYVAGTPQAADDARDAAWIDCDIVRAGSLPMSARVREVMELAEARIATGIPTGRQARRRAPNRASPTADTR